MNVFRNYVLTISLMTHTKQLYKPIYGTQKMHDFIPEYIYRNIEALKLILMIKNVNIEKPN